METLEAIMTIIDLTSEKATRTVIQKLCYFLEASGIIDAEFRPHHYGPYSDDIQESLSSLIGLKFIDEIAEKYENAYFRWGGRKYTYNITEDGKILLEKQRNNFQYDEIKGIVEKCQKIANLNLDILSVAAKIHYILIKEGREMSAGQVLEEAKEQGWEIDRQNTEKAVTLLEALGLLTFPGEEHEY